MIKSSLEVSDIVCSNILVGGGTGDSLARVVVAISLSQGFVTHVRVFSVGYQWISSSVSEG